MSAVSATAHAPPPRNALAFSCELLLEQGLSPLALGSSARALALLLGRSRGTDPVVLSGVEAASACGFA